MYKNIIVILLIILTFISAPSHAADDKSYSTAIIINSEIITNLDVIQRLKIALVTSGLQETEQNKRLLLPQIVQILIDESLYRQEATKLGINITEQDLQSAVQSIEQKNNLPIGSFNQFLEANGLSKNSFLKQLEAQIAWKKIISRKIKPFISVSQKEVAEELEYINSNKSQEEVFISEITLPIENDSQAPKIQALANQLFAQLQRGSSFGNIAKQFSRSTSAEKNGEIGWIETNQLTKPLKNAILTLKVNDISAPIRTMNSYKIVKLHKRRIIDHSQKKNTDNSLVSIKQLFIPISKYTEPNIVPKLQSKLEDVATTNDITCSNINEIASTINESQSTKEISTEIKNLHPEIRPAVEKLKINETSPIIRTSLGLHIFALCDQKLPEIRIAPPSKYVVKEKLVQKKLILETRKYLRNLRRETFIEVRL